jgi:hypothetical protein
MLDVAVQNLNTTGQTDGASWLYIVFGVLLLLIVTWSWSGATVGSRWWVKNIGNKRGSGFHPLVLGFLPGLGMLSIAGGIYHLVSHNSPWMVLAYILFIAGTLIFFGGIFFHPRWWGPRWFRTIWDERETRRSR